MFQEIKQGSIVEVYNKYLPFYPKKHEGTSLGVIIAYYEEDGRYEVMVEGIHGHGGSSHSFVENRWYVTRDAIKVSQRVSNYIKEVE